MFIILSFFFVFVANALKLKISDSLSIQFYKPQLVADAEWPDKFVRLESNYVIGDLGIGDTTVNNTATFTAIRSENTTTWSKAYSDNFTNPAVGFSFPINSNTLTNLGEYYPKIPPNQTIKSYTTTNYSRFYENSTSHKLLFNKTWPNKMYFSGVPYGIYKYANHFDWGQRYGVSNVLLPDDTYLQTAIVTWGGGYNNASMSVISFKSNDLINWYFYSIIANASQYPNSVEGPNENDMTYLSDGKTLFCLLRMDAGDSHGTSGPYKYYSKTISTDYGKTWSKLESIDHMGCAKPRLRMFQMNKDNFVLLASGGRMRNENTTDILLWFNKNGDGVNWGNMISISYIHNELLQSGPYLFTPNVNSTTYSPRETNSYTSLINWNQNMKNDNTANGMITYDMIKNGNHYVFSMDFMLQLT